jgi:hypothetical protein
MRSATQIRSVLAFLLLGSGAALAQEPNLAAAAAKRFPQPVRVGDLIDRIVRQPRPDRPSLGHVSQVVRSSDGAVKLVIDYGGVFGFGSRPIAVPADAMALLGVEVEILAYTPTQLAAFPTYRAAGDVPVGSDETIRMALASPSH